MEIGILLFAGCMAFLAIRRLAAGSSAPPETPERDPTGQVPPEAEATGPSARATPVRRVSLDKEEEDDAVGFRRHPSPSRPAPYATPQHPRLLKGKAWVIDGDTIVIDGTHIRLAGIDAPELNHPWGRKSKSAMIGLCRGQVVTAEIQPGNSYDRIVATCSLPDGRDLAAELVRLGLAIDWAKYSGGRYRHLEPDGIRKKLWRADAKQKGHYDERRHG